MKKSFVRSALAAVACAALLGACGGGGDEAGSITEFSVFPDAVGWKGPTGMCMAGEAALVRIVGGAAPYHVSVSTRLAVALRTVDAADDPANNRTEMQVDHPRGAFVIVYTDTQVCFEDSIVLVLDKLDRPAVVALTSEVGD